MDLYSSGVTIGELARRSGVGISTLRSWERRHGFPVPQRLPSGHRRYSRTCVDAVLAAVRDRAAGSTLEAALGRARALVSAPSSSAFATLRHALADVAPVALPKTTLLAISRAIEDEAATRTDDALVLGVFQQARFWRPTRPAWRRLATRAGLTVVLAQSCRATRHGSLWEVPIDDGAAIGQEWVVICDSGSFSACLAGLERPDQTGRADRDRLFEALWTVEPAAVRETARTVAAIARASTPDLGDLLDHRLRQPAVATYGTIRTATILTNRIITYCAPTAGRAAAR